MSAPAEGDGVTLTLGYLCALQAGARSLDLRGWREHLAQPGNGQPARTRGRGVDYVESRVYRPGDDIRSMDWRVTARSGRPHTKLYQEDNAQRICLLVDVCPSLFFGTRRVFKSVVAAEAVALLCWAAVQQGAKVSALLSNGARRIEIRDRAGRQGALALLQALVSLSNAGSAGPQEVQPLSVLLRRVRPLLQPGTVLPVISDFTSLDADGERELARLAAHNILLLVQVYDPLEAAPPPPGRYAITDGRETAVMDTRERSVRADYHQHFAARRTRLRVLADRSAVPLLSVCTADDAVDTLVAALGAHASRHAGRRAGGDDVVV